MGVPKFFRYISERYPCLSEVVREYQIPEFDNLYLDMNGIIHQCSHPDDGNVHFRITEEKIFRDVFHYIEVLFRMIKPQKLFFMAVDGVAPRAKMNQQRGRRFRSAKDAEKRKLQALSKGESLPEGELFDSNCITPGTVFMARLHEQLKYFVTHKISSDPLWQKCKVILSGHETPGEGEHKIMDYIRYMRAQPGYNPNTRHCLYGLDADLIMLGLCTHEPHFSLLREEVNGKICRIDTTELPLYVTMDKIEVKFGRKNTKRISVPEEIKFYLLHLSLMREYLELEFAELKEKLVEFDFDLESIIDDWVLMGFLVGNDFIPHLPNLHIANGALHVLYKAYLEVLPTLDGYINENGKLNLARFQKFMEKLSSIDVENFEETRDDLLYMQHKTGRKMEAHSKVSSKPPEEDDGSAQDSSVRDSGLAALIQEADLMCLESDDEEDKREISDDEEAFSNFKKEYYQNKLEYKDVTPEVMKDQAEGYVRAIQWNLNYYYNGCCSWSWFYPHHYAPYISDVKNFSKLDIEFDYGKPFLPFEQLLAVLPPLSKNLLPNCYHELMVGETSLLSKYYPEDFQTDLNGKRQEWEAVVLVPFIDENVLLGEMQHYNKNLTDEERRRNSHGPMLVYTYTPSDNGLYQAPEYFPPVIHNHTKVETMLFTDVLLPEDKLIKGLHPKASKTVYYPGFPTMRHLKYRGELRKEKLRIFESPSRNESVIIMLIPDSQFSGQQIPVDLLGTNVFVGWPHLTEARVVAISNANRKYLCMGGPNQYDVEERTGQLATQFKKEVEGVRELYEKRMGIEVGEIKVLVHVQQVIGKKYIFNSKGKLVLEKQFTNITSNYPLQAIVYNIAVYDGDMDLEKNIDDLFPLSSVCFTLTNPHYGSQGRVEENLIKKHGRIKISVTVLDEPDFAAVRALQTTIRNNYRTLHTACSQLSMSHVLFSRITGSVYVTLSNVDGSTKSANIGLDLKFNKRNTETPGYTKKFGNTWFYTDKTIDVVKSYSERFPEVFDYMSQDSHFDNIPAEKLFGDEWEKRLDEVQEWLRSLPCYSLERQSCGVHTVEGEVIEEIERTVRDFTSSRKQIVTMQIKPNVIYIPEIQTSTLPPDPKVECQILDRIVNVRQGFTVPFGLKGTIVCIHESPNGSERDTMYDVVFDKPFENGMRMNCSEDRCYRLPKTAFINISYGKRLLEEKTGKPKDLIAEAENFQKPPQNYQNNLLPFRQIQQRFPSQQQNYFGQMNSAFAQFNQYCNQYQPDYNAVQCNNGAMQRGNLQQKYLDSSVQRKAAQEVSPKQNKRPEKKEPTAVNSHKNIFLPSFAMKAEVSNDKKSVAEVQKPHNATEVQKPHNVTEVENPPNVPQKQKNANQPKSISEGRPKKESAMPRRPNPDREKQKTVVNTQFLRNMLGIKPENPQDDRTKRSSTQESKPSPSNNEDGVNISFDQLAQVANIPASIRLLTYYQSNGLGLPRYQYLNCGASIQAKIKLADGTVICGKPGSDREEAAEHVAVEVLELLMKNVNQHENVRAKQKIPVPPQSWIKSENTDEKNQKQMEPKSVASIPIDNKAFVPLQVFKNQIKSASKEPVPRNEEQGGGSIVASKDNSAEKKQSVKRPFQPRKIRIAANFKMKE